MGLVKKGAAISIAGGILAVVGAVFIALGALRANWEGASFIPTWVYDFTLFFSIGMAIFALGAGLALMGLAAAAED